MRALKSAIVGIAVGVLLLAAGAFAIPENAAALSTLPIPIPIAHEFVDQSFLPWYASRQILHFSPVGQEFTPTEPILVAIDVRLDGINTHRGDDTITAIVRKGTIGSPVLATESQIVGAFFRGLVHFHFPTPLSVIPGDVYVLELQATKPTHGWIFDVGYPGGRGILFGQPEILTDFAFQTYYYEPIRFPVPDLVVTVERGLG